MILVICTVINATGLEELNARRYHLSLYLLDEVNAVAHLSGSRT